MVLASDDHYGSEALTECFQYHQRLEEREIRLIQLEIGSRQDEIVVQLSHKRINDDTIKYHALSYVWGSKSDAVTIKCDNRPLLITQNLHKALVQLREDGLRIPIWVDAVCIDQQNLDERARQVRLMRQIYSQAETVHVWIGEETANTEAGVELLHRTAKAVQDLPHDLTAGTSYPELKAMGLPHMFDSTWKAVAEIITRQWFGRVWVIQEMTVARKCIFICGRLKIEYEAVRTLARSLSYFSTLQNTLSINLPHDVSAGFSSFMISVLGLVATEYAESGSLLLRDLLFLTGAFQATEPKDRIFALLGITDDVPQEFINYNRSLREILIDVASMCLTRDRHKTAPPLDVLCFVNHIIQSPDLPSWVPVWDTKGRVFCPLHLILQPKEWIEVREASYSITGEKLLIRGKILDKVRTIIEATPYGKGMLAGLSETEIYASFPDLQAWHEEVCRLIASLTTYPTDMDLEEAQWRTLCFNGGMTHEPAPPYFRDAYEAFKLFVADLVQIHLNNNVINDVPGFAESARQHANDAKPFELALGRYPAGRRFCVTEKGYIGWVSLAAREGDEVAAFRGTRILFTLRSGEGGKRLTGDCYLQGLMEGESLRMSEMKEEDIVIV